MAVEASAPGKVILFGEHSVVYRGPAVVLAVDRRAGVIAEEEPDEKIFIDAVDLGVSGYFIGDTYYPIKGKARRGFRLAALNVVAKRTMDHIGVESGLRLTIKSEIPVAVGLGSSAAVSVATVAAVGELLGGSLSSEEICSLAYEGERVVHGTPSGVDNNISTYAGILRYEKDQGFKRFRVDSPPLFVIGNTRRKRSTRRLVEGVGALRERNTEVVDGIIDVLGRLSQKGLNALLEKEMIRLGDLMNINQGLLSSLGVSTSHLDQMIHASRNAGALGAKLTGAGGGGCIIALAKPSNLDKVARAIREEGGEAIQVSITYDGVMTRKVN